MEGKAAAKTHVGCRGDVGTDNQIVEIKTQLSIAVMEWSTRW